MSRETHVQFCERLGVKLPGATHPPRIVLIRGFTAGLLFFRNGSNDQLASAAPRQRPFSLRDGSSDKFLNLWTRQRRRGLT